MSFALFIVLNGLVLIRPEDFLPEITGARLYLIVMSLCILTALPKFAAQLSSRELALRPISVCVIGLLIATAVSNLVHGRFDYALDFVPDFAKVIVYFLLLCALVDTPRRLRIFLGWQLAFVTVLAVIAVLEFHEYLQLAAVKPLLEGYPDPATGAMIMESRMCSAGIFNDPNDLCLILVFGIMCSLYHASVAVEWLVSALWAMPSVLFVYSLILTRSRGGLLGCLAAVGTLIWCKYGWKRALPLLVLGLPAVVLAIGGRQSDIEVGGGTGHERIMFWAAGFGKIASSPLMTLFGIGAGQHEDVIHGSAHNSFVHAYVELGLLGGTFFLGAFATAVWLLVRLGQAAPTKLPRELGAAWPFVVAMVVGYGCGIYSLSRNYIVPTYLCLGVATTFLSMAMPNPPRSARVSKLWLMRLAAVGVAGLLFLKFFTQFAGGLGV